MDLAGLSELESLTVHGFLLLLGAWNLSLVPREPWTRINVQVNDSAKRGFGTKLEIAGIIAIIQLSIHLFRPCSGHIASFPMLLQGIKSQSQGKQRVTSATAGS
jgi:hypothetical protein